MSYLYGLEEEDLEELADLILGTHMPLGLGLRKLKLGTTVDHDVVTQQLKDELQVVKCSACHSWTDKSDEDAKGPLCPTCNDL